MNINAPTASINTPTASINMSTASINMPTASINAPDSARMIIDMLERNGFEAFVVGGCVRDSLMGRAPKDWDVCTSALPEQTLQVFRDFHVIKTGLKHGTVTVIAENDAIEVTTYRIDGDYSDNRRPDSVEFTRNLREDLSRRDFTVNAMAFNPKTGIADYFEGMDDLNARIIRCVGEPAKRFQEDALRIMRAMRFAAVLGFSIDDATASAMRENRGLLKNIAAERIAAELNGLIVGDRVRDVLQKNLSVLTEVIPELAAAAGFEQNNPYHCYDVLTHIFYSVENAPRDTRLRLTMLLHDVAKPERYTEKDGTGHFYGHARRSAEMAKEILLRLKYDNDTIHTVRELIFYHDADIRPHRKQIKKWLRKLGEKRMRELIEVKRADAKAQAAPYSDEKLAALFNTAALIDDVIEQGQCFSLKDLAVNGRDLISAGVPEGTMIGTILDRLVDMVIDEKVENDRAALLELAKQMQIE